MAQALIFAVLLLCLPAPSAGGETPSAYRLVRPSDPAHDLLPKTCRVCHKEGDLRFLIVAAPDDEALERAAELLSGQAAAGGAKGSGPANPHRAVACLFCHTEEPKAGDSAERMLFRSLEGGPTARTEIVGLCELCHPEGSEDHPRVLRAEAGPEGLARVGLPVVDGKVLCTTCHDMHEERVGPACVRPAFAEFAARSADSYPHGNRATCRTCHTKEHPAGASAEFREPDATARCVPCHEADHGGVHPMGVESTARTYPLDFLGYPLGTDRRLTCSTCHDHPCRERIDRRNPRFLRGGPYVVTGEFCYRCHPRAGAGALNPHRQVDPAGKIIATSCAFCHRRVPDPDDPEEAYFGPEDLVFVHSPVELCVACHALVPHPDVNHLVEMSEDRVRKVRQYEERHSVKLPLYRDSQVVCTTCHNPHDKGVLRGKAALGAQELHQWRVPSFAELCTPCHARYD